jgi:Fe-S cluster assembly iron-binding protein IscA
LTDHALSAVRALTPQAPESAWLRIAPGNQGFEFSLVTEPVPGDALIDDGKVQVFVEPQTARLLDEQTLDAQLDEGGEVNFFLASPDAMPPPGGDDDGTAARHVASRAELLPEEQAAGSDDQQAQARGILEESEERTEQPEPGASSPSSREAPPED